MESEDIKGTMASTIKDIQLSAGLKITMAENSKVPEDITGSAKFSIGEGSISSKIDGYMSSSFDGGFNGLNAEASLSTDKISINASLGSLKFDGDLPSRVMMRMTVINGLEAKNLKIDATITDIQNPVIDAKATLESLDAVAKIGGAKADISASGIEVIIGNNGPEGLTVASANFGMDAPTEYLQKIDGTISDLKATASGGYSMKSMDIKGTYPDKSMMTIVAKDVVVSEEKNSGSVEISGISKEMGTEMEFDMPEDVSLTIKDSYVGYIGMAGGKNVSGDVYLVSGTSIEYDGGEFYIPASSYGIEVHAFIDDGKITSATFAPVKGYDALPEYKEGVKYTLKDNVGTIEEFNGGLYATATPIVYTVTAGDKEYKAEFENFIIDIEAPVDKEGFEFYGWFDGYTITTDGLAYQLEVPSDVVLTPIWTIENVEWTASDKTYVINGAGAETVFINSEKLDDLIADMSGKDMDSVKIGTEYGYAELDYYSLLYMSTLSVSIYKVDPIDPLVAEVTKGQTVYNIDVTYNTGSYMMGNSGNTGATFTITHKLESGQSADNLSVYNVNQYGRVAEISDVITKDNGDGTVDVTFSTPYGTSEGFDGYYIDTSSEGSSDNGGGISMAMIFGVIVVVILITALAFLFIKRKNANA